MSGRTDLAQKTQTRVSSENNPSKPTKPTKPTKARARYDPGMTVLIVILAALGLLALLGGLVTFAYLCAMGTGRALAWVFQIESGQAAREADELLSPEELAEIDALVAHSQRMARDAQRRADAWPAAR